MAITKTLHCSESGGAVEHFAIGYVHNDTLLLVNIPLQYGHCKTIAVRSDGVSDDFLHFLKIKK